MTDFVTLCIYMIRFAFHTTRNVKAWWFIDENFYNFKVSQFWCVRNQKRLSDIKLLALLTVKVWILCFVLIFNMAHQQKACLIRKTQQKTVRVIFLDEYEMWQLTFVISCDLGSVMWLVFKAGTQEWRGAWCSILAGGGWLLMLREDGVLCWRVFSQSQLSRTLQACTVNTCL